SVASEVVTGRCADPLAFAAVASLAEAAGCGEGTEVLAEFLGSVLGTRAVLARGTGALSKLGVGAVVLSAGPVLVRRSTELV
nr:hypothetical protein [Tanacetum cinerariifolium]